VLRTPRIPLLGALACAIGLALTGVLAYLVPLAHAKDAISLQAFLALNRPRLTPTIEHVAHLADPAPYALIGLSLALVALARGRGRVALAIVVLLIATGVTTEGLKHLLATQRPSEWLGEGQIALASWPSGHATASMTLALCAVLAAPARLRPIVAGLGACFAIAVSYAILALGWHFPSDVIGGFFVAALWTLLAVAALITLEGPKELRRDAHAREGAVMATMGAGMAAVVFLVAAARPAQLSTFAQEHTSFFVVGSAIAVLATGLALAVSGSAPAPRAAPRRRSRHG
jgi:membrane-associated phospholipid phosphatase